MDDAEHQIEQTTNKFTKIFSSSVSAMSPVEISLTKNKENELTQIIDLYEAKMNLMHELEEPDKVPQPYSFSQQILDSLNVSADLPSDTTKALSRFYTEEIKRVSEKIEIINQRCKSHKSFVEIIPQLSLVVEAEAKYVMKCKDSLSRLGISTLTSFTNEDIKYELQNKFYKRAQKAFMNEIIDTVSLFPITRRRSIYQSFVDKVIELFDLDKNPKSITTFLYKESDIDKKIHRLATLFNIDSDIEENDGQSFTYKCDSLFNKILHNLTMSEIPRRAIEVPIPPVKLKKHELVYNSIIASLREDHKTTAIFEKIRKMKDYQLSTDIKEKSSFYNTFVGNGISNKPLNLPQYKIYTMLELRCIHLKFLWEMFSHYINYFQYVRYTVANKDGKFKVRKSNKFKEFIEVYDENGQFIFSSTDAILDSYILKLSRICGHFSSRGNQKIIDRELVVERILELEVELCSVKYAAISPLMEILQHCNSQCIKDQIHTIINVAPTIDITLVISFESPYLILIDTLKLQAKLTRQIINAQILHLRNIAARGQQVIPIFDRPHFIPCPFSNAFQDGAIPITPFEVYELLADIGNIFDIIDKLIPELLEDGDIKADKFYTFMAYAVWEEVNKRVESIFTEGIFPYDIMRANAKMHYSDSVNSLFSSRFLNSLDPLEKMLTTMNSGRQMRAILSARRLYNFTWKLQKEIMRTVSLQAAYLEQCTEMGVTDNYVQLSPLSNTMVNETTLPEDIVEFALAEFSPIGIDFSNITFLKDVLFTGNFFTINEIFQAQQQQNMYFETAVRYNNFMLDNFQFVKMFQLINDDTQNLFVTEQEANEILESNAKVYNKQFMARLVLYESQNLALNIEMFKKDNSPYFLNIKRIKQTLRSNLRGQIKNISFTSSDTKDLYFSSLIEAFTAFLYKTEIAKICGIERRILLTNSFVDTFLIGPVEGQTFVNEVGRFENFFYIPSWTEVFTTMSTSGYPRQTAVLKWVIPYIISRLRILCYARYIACLDQKPETIFEAIASQKLTVETTIFQKLQNEFQRIPNSREIDVLAGFVHDKEVYFYKLFELALLSTFNSCFIFMKSELSSAGLQRQVTASGEKELKFGEIIKEIILSTKVQLPDVNSSERYIPQWQNEFAYKINEENREELAKQLSVTEGYVERSLSKIKNQSFLDSFQMVQPMTSFIENCISSNIIKYAFFQVISNIDYRTLSKITAVTGLTQAHYLTGDSIWNDVIIKEATKKLTPKGETLPKKIPPEYVPRFIKIIIEIVLDHFETTINDQQAKHIQKQSEEILTGLRVPKENIENMRPDTFMITIKMNDNNSFLITPKDADQQFTEELNFSKAAILTYLCNIVKSIRKEYNGKKGKGYSINESKLKDKCKYLSEVITLFMNSSLHDEVLTWKQYNIAAIELMEEKTKDEESLDCVESYIRIRNKRETAAKISATYKNEILVLNSLEDKKHTIVSGMTQTNLKIENELRVGYNDLIKDFYKRIEEEKLTFIQRRKTIYQMILDILKKGHTLEPNDNNSKGLRSSNDNDKVLQKAKDDNAELLNRVKKLRIIRAFSDIAMRKLFARKMLSAERDRRQVNASLWSNRLMYEMQGAEMEEQLRQAQDRLTESEAELEQVKHNLEIEKSSNIDMVQWKATNSNRIDILKKEIERVRAPKDSPNIYGLLKRLEEAQDELDMLKEETEKLDTIKANNIDKTIKKTARVRTAIVKSRQKHLSTIGNSFSRTEEDELMTEETKTLMNYLNENDYLKRKNAQMRQEIAKYSECIKKYPPQTIKMMEKTAALSRPKTSAIVRPSMKSTSRSCGSKSEFNRKRSRINIFI